MTEKFDLTRHIIIPFCIKNDLTFEMDTKGGKSYFYFLKDALRTGAFVKYDNDLEYPLYYPGLIEERCTEKGCTSETLGRGVRNFQAAGIAAINMLKARVEGGEKIDISSRPWRTNK